MVRILTGHIPGDLPLVMATSCYDYGVISNETILNAEAIVNSLVNVSIVPVVMLRNFGSESIYVCEFLTNIVKILKYISTFIKSTDYANKLGHKQAVRYNIKLIIPAS